MIKLTALIILLSLFLFSCTDVYQETAVTISECSGDVQMRSFDGKQTSWPPLNLGERTQNEFKKWYNSDKYRLCEYRESSSEGRAYRILVTFQEK